MERSGSVLFSAVAALLQLVTKDRALSPGISFGSFVGANIAYRASEYPAVTDPNSAKADVTALSVQFGF